MQILSVFIGSGGLIGVLLLFFYCGKWFGKMEARFDIIDKKFETVLQEIKEMRKDIAVLDNRISKLEVRVEERTLRVIHVQKQFPELLPVNEN